MFALKMCVADLKVILRKFWWLGFVFLGVIILLPLHGGAMHALSYFIVMTISLFVPRYSKIHFVLPLDEKQVRRFFLWRIVIVCAMMIIFTLAVAGSSILLNWPWEPRGLQWIMSYLICYVLFAEFGFMGMFENKKLGNGVRQVLAIVIGIVSMIMGICVTEVSPLKFFLIASVVLLLIAVIDVVLYLKNIRLENYSYRPLGIWDNGKVERD